MIIALEAAAKMDISLADIADALMDQAHLDILLAEFCQGTLDRLRPM